MSQTEAGLSPKGMKGKAAIVTGAASGLGRATALLLGQAGADIGLVDIDPQRLAEVEAEITACGVRALALPADLSLQAECERIVPAVLAHFGRLDALCNVAGVMLPGHSETLPLADFQKTLAVNLTAPFCLIQGAMPHLIESKGAVVNVTSVVGFVSQAYNAAYCASKAGLAQMTKALAMEYIHTPVRINAVAPGGMATGIVMGMTKIANPDPSLMHRLAPLRGMVEVDEVARMVAFLASDAAQGYHGSVIVIDNGLTAG